MIDVNYVSDLIPQPQHKRPPNPKSTGGGEILEKLLKNKWEDDYLRLLSIYDHLVECKMKYEAYKMAAVNKDFSKEELKKELFKELTDLHILLDICKLKAGSSPYNERLQAFMSKL